MPTAAEREAFMQMMGINAADVIDPGAKASRAPGRHNGSGDSAARAHGLQGSGKPSHPSGIESVSSSVGLSTSSAGSSTLLMSQRQSAEKRRAFLAELGIAETCLEEPPSDSGATTIPTAMPSHGAARPDSSARHHGSEVSSAAMSSPPPPVPRRALAGSTGSSRGASTASVEDLKAAGNTAFEQGQFTQAVRYYTLAIDALQSDSAVSRQDRTLDGFLNGTPSTSSASTRVQLAALYSNRSAAYLQGAKQCDSLESAFDHALYDADQAVTLRGDWFKGYSRQGDVYFKMQRYAQAADAFQMAMHLEPGNTSIAMSLEESRERARLQARRGRGAVGTHAAEVRAGDGDNFPLGHTALAAPTPELFSSATRNDGLRDGATSASSSARREYGLYDHGLPKTAPRAGSQPLPHASRATYSPGDRPGLTRKSSFDAYYGDDHRDVRQEWNRLKRDVENTTHDPTGNDYRRREIEKFRMQRSTGQRSEGRSFASLRTSFQSNPLVSGSHSSHSGDAEPHAPAATSSSSTGDGGARRTPQFTTQGRASAQQRGSVDSDGEKHLNTMDIPAEFSSVAASTYQQKLLEEFRRRKENKGQ